MKTCKSITRNGTRSVAASRAGFTMAEVLMGGAVMAVAFVSIFGILTVGIFTTQTSRENLRATQILADKMEGLRLYNASELTNTALLAPSFTNWYCETNTTGDVNAQGSGVQYTGSVAISDAPFTTAYSSNLFQVTVTVSWVSNGQGEISHTRSMSTFFAKNGMANYVYNNY